jgi:hypothetical protein
MIKQIVAIIVLTVILVLLLPYVKKSETPAIEESQEINFVQEGVLTFEPTGAQDKPYFNYKSSPEAPTTTMEILIDETTICASPTGSLPCMALSSLYSNFFGERRVRLEAVEKEARVTAKSLTILNE